MIQFFARQWLRFLASAQFLALLNFVLLAYSTKLLWLIPVAVIGGWLVGWWILDSARFNVKLENESTSRSPTWARLFAKLDELEKKIDAK